MMIRHREVHHHLAGGDWALHRWLEYYGIEPALRLSTRQAEALLRALHARLRNSSRI